jgi:hypothetical protein
MRSPNAKTLLATGLATALLGNAVASTMCRTDGSSASFKWDYSNADYVLVTSNGCPDHAFENSVGQNPNSATVKNWSFRLPKKPIIRDNSRGYNVKVIQSQGPVGISLSGAPIFGPATSQQSDAYGVYAGQRIALYGDAGADPDQHGELDTFDYCGGHSTPDGCYHYHVDPYCIRKSGETPGKLHSALLGFMSDGIPLYGIYNDYGQIPTDLDTCGGHASDSGADGLYHYHMRSVPGPFPQEEGLDKYDPTYFPYTPTCLMGCIYDETSNSNKVQQETYSTCSRSGTKSSSGMWRTIAILLWIMTTRSRFLTIL